MSLVDMMLFLIHSFSLCWCLTGVCFRMVSFSLCLLPSLLLFPETTFSSQTTCNLNCEWPVMPSCEVLHCISTRFTNWDVSETSLSFLSLTNCTVLLWSDRQVVDGRKHLHIKSLYNKSTKFHTVKILFFKKNKSCIENVTFIKSMWI